MSSLYYSGDTRTNQGTSLRRPGDARRRAQIRSDVLRQAAEDLVNEQAQVERRDPLSRDRQWAACEEGDEGELQLASWSINKAQREG
jgi:hypothetical protein